MVADVSSADQKSEASEAGKHPPISPRFKLVAKIFPFTKCVIEYEFVTKIS